MNVFYSSECLFCMFFIPFTAFTFLLHCFVHRQYWVKGGCRFSVSVQMSPKYWVCGRWTPSIRAANTITERLERAFTLYYRWIGSLIKKGEAGEGGRFYVNNIFRWTKTSFRGNFQNEMIRSNRNNRCQIIFKTLLNPFWQDNYLTLLIDFSKVRFPPDKTLIL